MLHTIDMRVDSMMSQESICYLYRLPNGNVWKMTVWAATGSVGLAKETETYEMPKSKRARGRPDLGCEPATQKVDPSYAARALDKMERLASGARKAPRRKGARGKSSEGPPEAPA